jgi:ribonuclease HI
MAAIIGLEHAVTLGAVSVKLLADSELLVKQVNGQYKVKNEGLKPLYAKVRCRNSLRRSAASRYNTSQGSGTGKRTLSPIKR